MQVMSHAADVTCNSCISAELTLLTTPSCGPWQSDSAQPGQTQRRTRLAPSLLPGWNIVHMPFKPINVWKSVSCSEQHYISNNTGMVQDSGTRQSQTSRMVFMREDMHLHTHSVTYVSNKYFAGVGSALLSPKSHTRPTLECETDASGAPW